MAKAKWHKLPAFTIPLFQSAHVYLATTREQFQHADKFLGGSGDEKPFNLGFASNYENTDTGERCYLIGVLISRSLRSFMSAPTSAFTFALMSA